mgnify:CR=1 FL=1
MWLFNLADGSKVRESIRETAVTEEVEGGFILSKLHESYDPVSIT